MLVARRIDADRTVAALEQLVIVNGVPELIRCDNGPELTAHALRDWCRLGQTGAAFIDPGAPWQNPFVESFTPASETNCSTSSSSRVWPAQVVIEDWRQDYNTNRPHSSLGMRSPAAFAAALTSSPPLGHASNCGWGRPRERIGNATAAVMSTAVVTPTRPTTGSG